MFSKSINFAKSIQFSIISQIPRTFQISRNLHNFSFLHGVISFVNCFNFTSSPISTISRISQYLRLGGAAFTPLWGFELVDAEKTAFETSVFLDRADVPSFFVNHVFLSFWVVFPFHFLSCSSMFFRIFGFYELFLHFLFIFFDFTDGTSKATELVSFRDKDKNMERTPPKKREEPDTCKLAHLRLKRKERETPPPEADGFLNFRWY